MSSLLDYHRLGELFDSPRLSSSLHCSTLSSTNFALSRSPGGRRSCRSIASKNSFRLRYARFPSSIVPSSSRYAIVTLPLSLLVLQQSLSCLALFLPTTTDLQQSWYERRAIVRCRSQLIGEVYEKALKRRDLSGVVNKDNPLSASGGKGKEASKGSTAKIVNLMSWDTQKYVLEYSPSYFHLEELLLTDHAFFGLVELRINLWVFHRL